MKNFYTRAFIPLLFILFVYLPGNLQAQCLCAGGIPAQSISQSITIPPTTVSTLSFGFQQFDPTVGNLSCVSFTDTVTGFSYTGARNTGPDSTAFLFNLSLSTKISGPGILITHPFTQIYGYDTLAPYGLPGDTITYGPANIITNPTGSASTTGNAAYIGIGTVPITLAINGGMITLDGGSNYKSSVSTTIGGTMSLIYYYCPLSVLSSSLQNFSASKKSNSVLLKWDAVNAETIDEFDIEYSNNGVDFTSAGQVQGNHSSNGSYSFNYNINSATGYLYFRIKQSSSTGRTGYSAIEKISLTDRNSTGVSIHPNPAVTGISLNFEQPLTGDYAIDLINTAGQVVMNRKMKLSAASSIPVSWSNKPAAGIYFTRITNTNTMEQQIVRVVIK